jgi:hypothetical protein
LCLSAFAPAIKPLANVIANYTRSDGQQEICEVYQNAHLLSVAGLEKGSVFNIPLFYKKHKINAQAQVAF